MNKPLLVLFLASALVGGGCAKTAPPRASAPPVSSEPLAWLPPEATTTVNPETMARNELNDALRAFQEVKSFRAKYVISKGSATLNTDIEVQKPDRFHGVITSTTSPKPSDIIGIGTLLYVKLPDGTWMPVENKDYAAQLQETFTAALRGNTADSVGAIPDRVAVTKRDDAVRGCALYEATLTATSSAETHLSICVSNGLPKTIAAQSTDGSISAEYRDYNVVFTIERPSVPKMGKK